ncbi:MAG TPA: type I polyketide synthase, partial [Candidatus Elarobacter sp.]|nr:type I polyketide synthase [Candidatus Elarobacter sp.]
DGAESRIALRGEGRFVERVVAPPPDLFGGAGTLRPLRDGEKFDLHIPNSGMLESAVLDVAARRTPFADEVEIEVEAAGLNFLDVIRAMGLFDPDPHGSPTLGTECAGTVVRVGSNVTQFAVGDQVVALSPAFQRVGAVTSHLVTSETLVAPKPRALTFAQAGALPCVYLTCYYALVEIARMRKGETLLVHSATGGVGLSAIEVARWLGLEVFATAGTDEKRAFLRALGVKHVMDSRAPGFAEAILAATGGRGVDAILNSLSGSAIPEGLTALAPYGRFLEIGKRDMWDDSRIGMGAFLQNRSFSGIDLATLVEDRPELVGEMLRTVMTMIDEGVLAPLPITVYAAANAADAFHQMAQAKHIGKIVIDTRPSEVLVRDDAPKVRADGTYLITGGVGALGLVSARALVDDGARHLVLCARRDPSPAALDVIAALRRDGAEVVVRQVDLADETAVSALLSEIRATMPPLRGVIHSAGVLADALLDRLTQQHFADVMAGKVEGAVLLDRLTRNDELDLFVMFSSIASLLGTPGQANYAAANAMLDALAEQRAADGRAALSIAWGPWADVGLAAAQANRGARISEQGLVSIAPDDGLALFRRVLTAAVPRVAAMHFDVARWCETVAADGRARTFEKLSRSSGHARTLVSGLSALRAATPENAPAELRRLVVDQLASVLRLQPEQIVGTKAFRALGLDSLMGLELRNRLERSLELKLSASVIWNYPTVDQVCAYLAGQLGIAAGEPAQNGAHAAANTLDGAADDLDSELAEAEALLASL